MLKTSELSEFAAALFVSSLISFASDVKLSVSVCTGGAKPSIFKVETVFVFKSNHANRLIVRVGDKQFAIGN